MQAYSSRFTHAMRTRPVEGLVNHLKLIKRQAYGRAGLACLQGRFAALGLIARITSTAPI
jgi:transposase